MVNTASQTAFNAEADNANDPGMCLQQCRIWADIPAKYPDAATAWRYATDRHPGNRVPPRGAAVYWGGGSSGYGHIAIALGNGKIRSTDAGGAGRVATVPLDWVEKNWGLPYAGWAPSINGVTIPGASGEDEDMPLNDADLKKIDQLIRDALGDYKPSYVDSFLAGEVDSRDPEPTTVKKGIRLSADMARKLDNGSGKSTVTAELSTRQLAMAIVAAVVIVAAFVIVVLAAA